jgi:PIN domain nuclease of toxin-antitoxin system
VTSVILDASALIALLRQEPGADIVRKRLADAMISAVNYSEVLKKTIEIGGLPGLVQVYVQNISLRIVPFDEDQAAASATLYPQTKPLGMSFADRACLALGLKEGGDVLTTERKMGLVELPIKVMVIRGKH